MEAALVIAALIAFIAGKIAYVTWLRNGIRARSIETSLPPDALRRAFTDKVAQLGWSIVDTDNPLVAQSPLLAGRRQQISLRIISVDQGRVRAAVEVPRVWKRYSLTNWGTPYKAHTLRMRINSFLGAVAHADPAASISIAG